MNLIGVAELARALGVSRQRASRIARGDGFPKPVERLAAGPVWRSADVRRWAKRTGRTLVAALTVALLLAPTALANAWRPARGVTTLMLSDGTYRPQPYQRWVDEAKVPTPGLTVLLHVENCPDTSTAVGCMTISPDGPPDPIVYLSPGGRVFPVFGPRQVLLHELGHVFDSLHPALHARYLANFGASGDVWDTSWEEHFAETYAMCALDLGFSRSVWHEHRPTFPQWRSACRLIRR